jgi:hypothetical protein
MLDFCTLIAFHIHTIGVGMAISIKVTGIFVIGELRTCARFVETCAPVVSLAVIGFWRTSHWSMGMVGRKGFLASQGAISGRSWTVWGLGIAGGI